MLRKPRLNSRVPTGTFYSQGDITPTHPFDHDISTFLYKTANAFFDAKPTWNKKHWIYDFRTNVHMTLNIKKLVKSDFDEFSERYNDEVRSKRRESKKIDRWKSALARQDAVRYELHNAGTSRKWRMMEYRGAN